MKKTWFQKWCVKWWLYAVCTLGALMLLVLLARWDLFSVQQRLMGLLSVLVAAHILEENSRPSTWQDMFTNLAAVLLFLLLTFIPTTNGMVILICVFGVGEALVHTLMGIIVYRRFKSKGKRTIYGPGSFSAYFMLLPLSIYAICWLAGQSLTGTDWAVGIGLLLFIILILIRIPQTLSAHAKDPRYEFKSYAYFGKFMN